MNKNNKNQVLTEAMLPKLRKTVHIEGEKKRKSFAKHRRKSYVYDAKKDKYIKAWRNSPKNGMTKKELKEFYGHNFKVTFEPVRECEIKELNITLHFNRSNQFINFEGVENEEDKEMLTGLFGQQIGSVLRFLQDM